MKNLYIPKTLKVGYQERDGTYTGKLAFIVYIDDKGKLRKETSWRNWCKHFLDDCANVPTEGFVLNKGVGGQRQSWGWNARNEYIRVYDPRGWEFEISVANLLYILQECTSTKGKGLEGEFVYSWDGKELVLLPVDTYEYEQSSNFTKDQAKKVTKVDMEEGRQYRFKDGKVATYLGRHACTEERNITLKLNLKKHHVFKFVKEKESEWGYNYTLQKGFTKLAEVLEKDEGYADKLETFLKGTMCNPIVDYKWVETFPPERFDYWNSAKGRAFWKESKDSESIYMSRFVTHKSYRKALPISVTQDLNSVFDLCTNYRYAYNSPEDTVTEGKYFIKPIFILESGEEIEL
jgi:hypothetical protein